ncbi:MAG: hypothetical protein ACRDSL_07845 [Pseudonocardiaceae bacterium]
MNPTRRRARCARVVVTASGRAQYEQLCDLQGIVPYPVVDIDYF